MGTKTCRRCNCEKSIADFYKHSKMLDGHLNICKTCVKNRVKTHRRENDSVRDYDRWRYHNQPHRKQGVFLKTKKYRANNPEKYKAHTMVNNAIRDRRLTKKPCEVCGNEKSHAHHDDYSKPLDVKWLCAMHHQRLHHSEKF